MTSEGLGEMFEGEPADMCVGKLPLVSMGGQAEGLACADPGARTSIGASGNFLYPHADFSLCKQQTFQQSLKTKFYTSYFDISPSASYL